MHDPEHARLLGGLRWRPDALVLGKVAIAATTAACLGLIAYAEWLPALAVAGVAALGVCAVSRPRTFRIAAFVGVVVLPFVTAWPALRPDEYNYAVYFAALLLALVGLGAFQPRMFTAGVGSLYLGYIALAGTVAVLARDGVSGLPRLVYLLAAFAVYTLVRRADAGERRLLVALVIAFGVVQSLLAVMQTLFGWPVFQVVLPRLLQSERNYFAYVLPGVTRLVTQGSGTFSHFNALGAVLSLCLPLAVGVWLGSSRSPWRLAAVAITTAGVIATFSRGALLGALVGVVFVLWFGPTRSRRATILLFACFVMLVALLGANIANQYFETTGNLNIRVQTWQRALDDALDRPSRLIAGHGFEYFRTEVLHAGLGGDVLARRSTYMATLHSGWVQLLLEFGVVGTVLFFLWLVDVFSRFRHTTTPVVPALGGAAGLLASQALDNALFSYGGVLLVTLLAVVEGEKGPPRLPVNQRATPQTDRRHCASGQNGP